MSQTSPQTNATHGQSLPVGTQLEEFVIERVLGSGGFGITYLARDQRLGRQVVIKENLPAQFCWRDTHALTVRPRHTEGEDADNFQYSLESFEREASTLASLDHPGIVRVLRSFEAYGTAYFVMPFVEGTALDEQIRARQESGQDFTEDELGGMLWRVLDALAYLHDRGIYHRDIKPGNILVTATGEPVLIDFGAARQRLSERSLTVIESAGYTPFEQLQTRGKVGPWSDIYALGGTLYKSITGETPAKAADRIMDDPVVPLAERQEVRARYSSRFLKSIDKAMAPKAADRFQDAGQWRDWVWKSTSHAQPEVAHQEPAVAETAPSTPPELPTAATGPVLHQRETHQSFERPPRPESPPPPLPGRPAKKTSVASLLAVAAIVIAVFGSVAYLIMPSAVTPEGWDPRAASREEVDRYADAGVLHAKVEQAVRVLMEAEKSGSEVSSSKIVRDAIQSLQMAALKNDSRAMYVLGVIYMNGMGLPKDAAEAWNWHRKAADAGDMNAMYELGNIYEAGIGVTKDETEAAKWYKQAADSGNPSAMNSLGVAFEYGSGVAKDPAEAVKWYSEAAEAGNEEAMTNLGNCYADGMGVIKDETLAASWYRKGAEGGSGYGMRKLGEALMIGMGGMKNESEAVAWFRKAADLGDATAMTTLGECYQSGSGVQKDPSQALAWFRKAAEAGDATGMFHLGFAYGTAAGVPRNDAEAMKWFRMAADQGDISAMYNLGVGSEFGLGMAKNEVEAANWYRKTAAEGSEGAMSSLGRCYATGIGLQKDEVQAVNWYRKAAEAGDARGMFLLGSSYLSGSGVAKDEAGAVTWYQKAAEAGDDSAMGSLGWCFANGIGVNRDLGTAVRWYQQAAEAGNTISMYEIGDCYRIGSGVPKDSHQAMEWFAKSAEGEDLHLASKMEKLIFPQIQFQNATLEEAVEYMIVKSRDLDVTEETGIRWGVMIIIAERRFMQSNASLSLDLKNVPMIEALRYIAELSGMKLKIESHVVLLTPSS